MFMARLMVMFYGSYLKCDHSKRKNVCLLADGVSAQDFRCGQPYRTSLKKRCGGPHIRSGNYPVKTSDPRVACGVNEDVRLILVSRLGVYYWFSHTTLRLP